MLGYLSVGIRKMCHQKANGPRNAKQTVYFSFTSTILMISCGPAPFTLNWFPALLCKHCNTFQAFLTEIWNHLDMKQQHFILVWSQIQKIIHTGENISLLRGHFTFRSTDEWGVCFCTAQYSTAECTVHLSVRLGMCPTLLAMRWPFSLGISNLHNHCWLLLTGLSHCLSVWLETLWKSAACQKNFSLSDFPLSSAAGSESIIFHQVHKNRDLIMLAMIYSLLHQRFSSNIVYHYLKYSHSYSWNSLNLVP